jgi:3-phenylpropionate/trans-cinnamate dioxygenase ferredoxin subunit
MNIFKLEKEILEKLLPGKVVDFCMDGFSFCLAKHGETVFAFQPKCPHAGADLCDGFVDALGNVVCPLHHYKFNIVNGRNVSGEGYFLKRYQVEVREGEFYLLIP